MKLVNKTVYPIMARPRKKNRKESRRSGQRITSYAEDFYGKTPEARSKQLANLRQNSGKSKPKDPKPDTKALQEADIITFATEYLGVSFKERPAQGVILQSLYGLPLDAEQLVLYRQLTTNETEFEAGIEKTEADLGIGARGGKSFLVSIIALYESIVKADHWRKYLRKDEVGYAVITATRQKQCEDIIQASCTSLLENSSLKYFIDDALTAELRLKNGLAIVSMPCNSTAGRGLPIFLLIYDEIAHYRVEGPKADETIHNALRPRQAQFPGAKCLKITTVAAKQGLFWQEFDEGFQVPGRLTVQAPTRLVNPVIPKEFIEKEYKRDPDNAAREFGAQFAETTEGFFESSIEQLKASFDREGDYPYQPGALYFGSIDASGLAGRDKFALSIAHKDFQENKVIVDLSRSWDSKDLDYIMAEVKANAAIYNLTNISIDQYAKGYVLKALLKQGFVEEFIQIRDKLAALYVNFRMLVRAGKVSLPDTPTLRNGLMQTQAYYGKNNALSIGHERNIYGHGDEADSCVGAVYDASKNDSVSSLRVTRTTTYAEDCKASDYDIMNF